MVRAILDGKKTQTRRVIKHPENFENLGQWDVKCPYGQVGDQLWVRETWMPDAPQNGEWDDVAFYGCNMSPLSMIPNKYKKPDHCIFRSTWAGHELIGWKPSIFMPRWASRIQLEIINIRVERLQDISEADAVTEGLEIIEYKGHPAYRYSGGNPSGHGSAKGAYWALWEKINGNGSWESNPWVWVVEFKRIKP